MWVVSTLIGSIRKLRDDATGAAISPDGSRIAFLSGKRDEIRVMTLSGEAVRKIATAVQGFRFTELGWSPDGKKIAYIKRARGDGEYAIETRDIDTGEVTLLFSDPRLRSFCWAQDGSIVYSRMDSAAGATNFSLWKMQIDRLGVRAPGAARELATAAGQSFWYLTAAKDGQRIAFLRWNAQSDVWAGELHDHGRRFTNVRRVTADDRADWPSAWTRDSTELLFYSDRNGTFDIYKQALSEAAPTLTVFGPHEERWPQMSPDGASILFLGWAMAAGNLPPASGRLLRVPISGGQPSAVLDVSGYPGMAQVKGEGRTRPTARGYPSFRCASVNTGRCVIAEHLGKDIVFSTVDPVAGTREEAARQEVKPVTDSFWDLSPDGTAIAFVQLEEQKGSIRILRIRGGATQDITVKGWAHLDSVAWSSDGRALFVTSYSSRGSKLLRVSLDGELHLLRTSSMWMDTPVPSPDGRYLAFGQAVHQSNAWLIENSR